MDARRPPDRSIVDVGGSNRASARLAAVLFAVAGLLALANALSPQAAGHRTPTELVGLADLVVAAAAWLLPWDHWPSWSTIALAPPAFAIIVFANAVADMPPYTYGVFFVVVYLWIGLTMAPRIPLLLAPLATAAYVTPFLTGSGYGADAFASTFVAIPVCLLVGELLARTLRRVRQANVAARASAAALGQALVERERLDRLKSRFVAVVSHELRTPLTSIYASLEMLHDDLPPDSSGLRRLLDISVSNTERLSRLIDDLLDLQRIEAGQVRLNRRPCDGASLVRVAAELMAPAARDAGIRLTVQTESGRLVADPDRVVQTLTNLIGNALKFTEPGGNVRLRTSRRDGELWFAVRDDGRGIPADRLQSIFEPFEQVDASDARDRGGTGLGLAICRDLVAQHGGRIWAESTLGDGSEFTFTLPLAAGAEPALDQPIGVGSPSDPRTSQPEAS
jgi:signal transduction histidine kinase